MPGSVGVDGRRAGGGLPAYVLLHRGRRAGRQPAVPHRCRKPSCRCCAPTGAGYAAAGRPDRGGRRGGRSPSSPSSRCSRPCARRAAARLARAPGRQDAALRCRVPLALAAIPVLLYALLTRGLAPGGLTAGGLAGARQPTAGGSSRCARRSTTSGSSTCRGCRSCTIRTSRLSALTTWLDGSIGHFGWLDYAFPMGLQGGPLPFLRPRRARGDRSARATRDQAALPMFACFAVMAVGLLGAIGYAGIRYRLTTGFPFEQARYLFPLLPLYALFIVLAARGAGRRWAAPWALRWSCSRWPTACSPRR